MNEAEMSRDRPPGRERDMWGAADFWATSPCAPMLARAVTSVLRAHLYRSCHSGSGLCLYVVADQAMRMCI